MYLDYENYEMHRSISAFWWHIKNIHIKKDIMQALKKKKKQRIN